jgi:hypothetical protein
MLNLPDHGIVMLTVAEPRINELGSLAGGSFSKPQDSLRIGIDVARGPEESALYVVMGHKC